MTSYIYLTPKHTSINDNTTILNYKIRLSILTAALLKADPCPSNSSLFSAQIPPIDVIVASTYP